MLKTINPLLTGNLLSILSDMGHGDFVITDANFPAADRLALNGSADNGAPPAETGGRSWC